MTPDNFFKEYYNAFTQTPDFIRNYMENGEPMGMLKKIVKKYDMNEGAKNQLNNLVGRIFVGKLPPGELSKVIEEELSITDQLAAEIAAEINQNIFLLIFDYLEDIYPDDIFVQGLSESQKRKIKSERHNNPFYVFDLVSLRSLEGEIHISFETVNIERAIVKISKWFSKQKPFWPSELTDDVISKNLQRVYVAHWVLSGKANGRWSASIGTDYTYSYTREGLEKCSTCRGSGRVEKVIYIGPGNYQDCYNCYGSGWKKVEYEETETETKWSNEEGYSEASIDGRVIENISDRIKIRCGERDLSADTLLFEIDNDPDISVPDTEEEFDDLVTKILFESGYALFVLKPNATDDQTGYKMAAEILNDEIESDSSYQASQLGHVRHLRIFDVEFHDIDAYTWLYPLYVGTYSHNGRAYRIEIDGITGEMYIEVPMMVKIIRIIKLIVIITGSIAILYLFGLIMNWW